MPSVSFHTLGCKLNYTETSTIGRDFKDRGYKVVPFGQESDVVVINTCTVTEEANRKCRQVIRRAIRKSPSAFVVVTGCYAQLNPNDIAKIEGVDLVLGANEKFELFGIAESFVKKEKSHIVVSCIDGHLDFSPAFSDSDRTRAFLKVQDGCDYSCSFCTIPMARGRSRSSKILEVVEQANLISERGAQEIVLSGVNIGLFGEESGTSLIELLSRLESDTDISRYRISSIEPNLLTDEIIEFVSDSRSFTPHFHIPLQSGDDTVLGLMRRRYRRSLYKQRVDKIKELMPDACIGSDVIVGFPGSEKNHFMNTLTFLEEQPVSYLHVFTYSERPHTFATDELTPKLGSVHVSERSRRNKILRALSEKKRLQFYREHLGTTRPVLWESTHDQQLISGFTDNYIRIEKPRDGSARGEVELVCLSELTSGGCVAAGSIFDLPVVGFGHCYP